MKRHLARLTGLEEKQLVPALTAALFIFCVLASYYVLKPLRDDIGLLLGKEYLSELFIATMIVMVVANPVYSALMNRFSRIGFIKLIYRFFTANILLFIVAFKYLEQWGLMPKSGTAVQVTGPAFAVGAVFFVWVSVFNLFAVSVFWSLMADLYDSRQSKKLFGLVGAGGTLGAIAGSWATTSLVGKIGATNLLFVSAVLLEAAVVTMVVLTRDYSEPERESRPGESDPSPLAGVSAIFRSPYLIAICLYLFLYTSTSTFLYFQKAAIVDAALSQREDRLAFFANIGIYVNLLTLFIQLFLTGRVLPFLGLTVGLSLVPIVTVGGFLALGAIPGLMPVAVVEVCRSAANYGISRPAREVLFTVVSRQERYLSKSFIDTFVYRGGDTVASAAFEAIQRLNISLAVMPLLAVPVAGLYWVVAIYLGRAQARRAAEAEEGSGSEIR